jgi:hypothetical protein
MSKILSESDLKEIKSFVYRNARPLEFALWQYHFENGCKENVLSALESKTRASLQKHFHEYRWDYHQDMASVLPNPTVYYYSGYEQAVSDALDELIDIRPKDGVWDIPWQWYDGGKYVKEFAISENWWKSFKQ